MKKLSTACPFLQGIEPTHLTQLLFRWQQDYNHLINPIWLNNDGQSVLALLPISAFYLLSPTHNQPVSDLSLLTLSAQALGKKVKKQQKFAVTLDDFTTCLIRYNNTQSTAYIGNNNTSHYTEGFIGFVNYDVASQSLRQPFDQSHIDAHYFHNSHLTDQAICAYFGHYPIYLTYDKDDDQCHWYLQVINNDQQRAKTSTQTVVQWLSQIIAKQKHTQTLQPTTGIPLQSRWTKSQYTTAFNTVQDYLQSGDCYQINLTQEWFGQLVSTEYLVDYLPTLHTTTNAPFAGYIGLQQFELLSCSPELFLTFIHDDNSTIKIITKPIKGTRPRGKDATEDQALKNQLANSEKDLAENVMIVDLLRNDLGKYAQIGTVDVPTPFAIESFSNVHHMVSTITATIKTGVHPLTVLFDSLPAGSITGTPKKRSVEIIQELEQQSRGAYCGTMGYLNFQGTGQFNVLIRTLQADHHGNVSLWAGGGITIASECHAEYQECLDKVSNIVTIVAKPHHKNS